MIDPKEILALFDEPTKNQGLILHYAYQAMPDLAAEVIRLWEIEKAARNLDQALSELRGEDKIPLTGGRIPFIIAATELKQALEAE